MESHSTEQLYPSRPQKLLAIHICHTITNYHQVLISSSAHFRDPTAYFAQVLQVCSWRISQPRLPRARAARVLIRIGEITHVQFGALHWKS